MQYERIKRKIAKLAVDQKKDRKWQKVVVFGGEGLRDGVGCSWELSRLVVESRRSGPSLREL